MVTRRDGILPQQRFLRNPRTRVARLGTHVAVRELEPRAREGVVERLRILMEALGDLEVRRVGAERDVGGAHGRTHLLARVMRIGHHERRFLVGGLPDLRAGRALGELPLEAEERVEVAVVPLGGVRRPGAFEPRRGGVRALAGAEAIGPAEAHHFDRRAFRFGAHEGRIAGAVHLAEGVTAGHKGHRLFVVHRHARERLADVAGRGHRIGDAVRAFGVHVDETHLHGRERILEFTVARIAAVFLLAGREPLAFAAPVDVLLGLPHVLSAEAEAEGLEAHRFHADVSGEDEEVGPRNLVAVLLLDRPQQAAGLVEIAVVGPAVEGRETLRAAARTTAAVGRAIGAGAVPRHAHEERAVVAVIGRPPILRVRLQRHEVGLERVHVELLERFAVLVARERIGERRMLTQDAHVEGIRPPVAVRAANRCAAGCVRGRRTVHHGALAPVATGMCFHRSLSPNGVGLAEGRALQSRRRTRICLVEG